MTESRRERVLREALERLPEDVAWSAHRRSDYQLALRLGRERAKKAEALGAAMVAHTDRLGVLIGLPPIDWAAAHNAVLASHAGLRLAR